jgi:hypothetical protein
MRPGCGPRGTRTATSLAPPLGMSSNPFLRRQLVTRPRTHPLLGRPEEIRMMLECLKDRHDGQPLKSVIGCWAKSSMSAKAALSSLARASAALRKDVRDEYIAEEDVLSRRVRRPQPALAIDPRCERRDAPQGRDRTSPTSSATDLPKRVGEVIANADRGIAFGHIQVAPTPQQFVELTMRATTQPGLPRTGLSQAVSPSTPKDFGR